MSKSNSAETECTFITRVCSTADVYKLRSLIQVGRKFPVSSEENVFT